MSNAEFPSASTQTWIPFFLGTSSSAEDWIPGSGIVALMESVDYPPSATRMALSRLCADGTVTRRRAGRRTLYRLTDQAAATVTALHQRVEDFGRDVVWSGSWTLVLVSIPDALRSTRRKMQGQLTYLGFGRLREAVWIAARDGAEEVADLARSLGVDDMVDIFLASPAALTATEDVLDRCWDMASLTSRYADFIARFAEVKRASVRRELSPDECVRWWMRMTYDYEDMVHRDPELPREFLPPAVRALRERVVKLYATVHPDLRARAVARVAELLTAQ